MGQLIYRPIFPPTGLEQIQYLTLLEENAWIVEESNAILQRVVGMMVPPRTNKSGRINTWQLVTLAYLNRTEIRPNCLLSGLPPVRPSTILVTLGLYRNRRVERIKGNPATFDNSQQNSLRSCMWVSGVVFSLQSLSLARERPAYI